MHHRLDFLTHVVVLVLYLHRAAAGKLHVGLPAQMLNLFLAALETCAVMVADDVGEHSLLHAALDSDKMVESFVTLGMFGESPIGEAWL